MEYNGPSPSQIAEGIEMQKWFDWYNSNAPDAVARRKEDELERERCEQNRRSEEQSYQQWLSANKERQQEELQKLYAVAQQRLYARMREIYKAEQFHLFMKNKYKTL